MIDQADIDRVNEQLRIEDVVAASGLTVVNRGSKFTTQEHDSLILYPLTNSWARYSQAGEKGKTLGGGVLDWFTKYEHMPFVDAYTKAAGMLGGLPPATVHKARPLAKQRVESVKDYREEAKVALRCLGTPAGEAVVTYLDSRGIDYMAAKAWGLGAHDWHGKPAVSFPHSDGQRVTVKVRLLPPTAPSDKCRWLGSAHVLFGEHMLPRCAEKRRTLFAIEGETNAVSIWVAAGRHLPVDAVSFGNKTVPSHLQDRLITLAKLYKHVFIWTDESEDTRKILAAIPGAIGIRTQYSGDVKLDANELLQRGWLAGYVAALIDRHATADEEEERTADDERAALAWALWDEAQTWQGISENETAVLHSLAQRLGMNIQGAL